MNLSEFFLRKTPVDEGHADSVTLQSLFDQQKLLCRDSAGCKTKRPRAARLVLTSIQSWHGGQHLSWDLETLISRGMKACMSRCDLKAFESRAAVFFL